MKWLLAIALGLCASAVAATPTGTPFAPVLAFWRVPDQYKITADGADDAPSIQRAINASCAASAVWGKGGVVRLLPRHYRINSQITVNCRLTLEGAGWQEAPDPTGEAPSAVPNPSIIAAAAGTWLDVGPSFNSQSAAASAPLLITGLASDGVIVRDIAFDEPDMTLPTAGGSSWTPSTYPPLIYAYNSGGYARFANLYFHGVYAGITANNVGRVVIEGLYGQIFTNFVSIDQNLDNSRINNIHHWPYWSQNAGVIAYTQAHAVTLALGRVDTPLIDNIVSFATAYGIAILPGGQGGTTTRAMVGKISCDSNVVCLGINAPLASISVAQMITFGQQGLSSGAPYTGSRALKITGNANVHIGYLYPAMFDHYAVEVANTQSCSTVQVGSLNADFTYSGSGAVAIFTAPACSTGSATNQVFLSMLPVLTTTSGQTFTYHNGVGAKVFAPNEVEQP